MQQDCGWKRWVNRSILKRVCANTQPNSSHKVMFNMLHRRMEPYLQREMPNVETDVKIIKKLEIMSTSMFSDFIWKTKN